MSVLNCIYFLFGIVLVHAIYIPPNDVSERKLSNVGIKTLGWQNSNGKSSNITMHHNYSKVNFNHPTPSELTYSQHSSSKPKVNQHIDITSQDSQINTHQPVTQNPSRQNQSTQTVEQTNFNLYNYALGNIYGINDHLNEFTNLNQDTNQQAKTIQNHANVVDQGKQPSLYNREVYNINGTRIFTNAHSSGYVQANSERPSHSIHFNVQNKRYAKEKIEVYKKCPKGATGQFVYELSCNQFLNCWKGRGFAQNCAPGTLFNPLTLECDFKDKVVCVTGPRQTTLERTEPLSASLQAKCPQDFSGIIPHYTDCAKFIHCNNGAEIVMDCAPGTLFDVKSNICDFPYKAQCVNAKVIYDRHNQLNQAMLDQSVVIQPYRRNVTYKLHSQNINDNLQDFNGGYSVQLIDSDGDNISTSSSQAERGGKAYESNAQHSINNQLGDFNINNGQPHDFNPNRYYSGQSTTSDTVNTGFYVTKSNQQHAQHYNQGSNQELLSNAGASEDRLSGQDIYNKAAVESKDNKNTPLCPMGASGLFSHPTICEKFLNCINGQTIVQDCGPGTVFNPTTNVCDFPYNVNCRSSQGFTDLQQKTAHTQNQFNDNQELSSSSGIYNGRWAEQNQYSRGTVRTQVHNNQPKCPLGASGLYSHPTQCEKFLNCANGQTFIQDCGPGTVFNPVMKVCDFPYNVNCKSEFPDIDVRNEGQQNQNYKMIAAWNEAYSTGLRENYCQNRVGYSSDPTNCTRFFYCDNGKLFIGICSENMYYSSSKETCEENINCNLIEQHGNNQEEIGGQAETQHIWQPNMQYKHFKLLEIGYEIYKLKLKSNYCRINNGFSLHPMDCAKFLLCTNGRIMLGICNFNTFYNPFTKTCDSNYNCAHIKQQWLNQNRETNDSQQWSNQQYENFRLVEGGNEMNILKLDMHYCRVNNGFSTHPKNCSKFLLCQNGKLFLGICRPGKSFNPESKFCDSNYKCRNEIDFQDGTSSQQNVQWENERFIIISAKDEIASLNLNINYCDDNEGLHEYPQNCSKFLYCRNGRPYIGICKFQMIYNQTTATCDFTSTCKSATYSNSEDTEINCLSKSNGLYPHPTICHKFINCLNGEGVIHGCASGTVFNPLTRVCDFSHNVKCDAEQNHSVSTQNEYQPENQNNKWNQEENQENQWSDQWNQEENQQNQWSDQSNQNQNQNNQWDDQWNQDSNQNNRWDDQWSQHSNKGGRTDENGEGFLTEKPINNGNVEISLTEDHTNKASSNWSPSFPTTDPNADYVFEVSDLMEVIVPDKPLKKTCEDEDFHCTKTTCIEPIRVCDGLKDCPDGEDEKNCETFLEEFSYIPGTKMAVQEKIKYDNITLTLCAKYCIESKGFTCKAFNFRADGTCFILTTNVGLSGKLVTWINYDYYEYIKYTVDCSDKYMCPNQKCIDEKQICNGIGDCVDRFDEKGCSVEQLGYSIQLKGSEKSYEGALQVTVLGKTGFVCDDKFNMDAANVVCKELGFELGAAEVKGHSQFARNLPHNDTIFMMDDVVCSGNEISIRDCDFRGWGIHNCMEKEIAGVVCKTAEVVCAAEYWKCETTNECVPLAFICDDVDDCSDNSDEASQYCDAPIEMKLVDGNTENEGRVEIKYQGTWGTICDDDFNDDAAKVICKYLGYSGPAHVMKDAYFGPGTGPIWLDQVFCHGNESTLVDCIKWDWGVHNCEHSEDVGIICNDYANAGSERNARIDEKPDIPLRPDRCGYRNDDIFLDNEDVHFRMVKGSVAKKGQYPWQASLRVKGKTRPSHWCGAVVISQKFVLTAAHCLHGFTKGAYIVVAGDYDVNEEEGTEQQIHIDEFYIHQDFRKGTKMNNDIALVRLKGDGFNITKHVQPICLPDADFMDETGLNCSVSGFGSVQSGKAVASKELRAGWVPIQPSEVCKMPHIYGKSITEGMICAGSLDGGVDACDGDSGGPLACLHNGLFTLIGVTSWGQHCGEANKPGVYVKIAHYRNWIDETMQKHS